MENQRCSEFKEYRCRGRLGKEWVEGCRERWLAGVSASWDTETPRRDHVEEVTVTNTGSPLLHDDLSDSTRYRTGAVLVRPGFQDTLKGPES